MPVIGPNYSRKQADEVTQEILDMLKEKYRIMRDEPVNLFPEKSLEMREEDKEALRQAIHSMFKHQSWEDW